MLRMSVYPFRTSWGRCEIHHAGAVVTAFRLPELGEVPNVAAPVWVMELAERVRAHLAGDLQDFADAPFAWELASSFQQAVYRALLAVKPGRTATYGELAATIGQPAAVSRAVGTALGQNRWPLLVPCHRCIGAHGHMTGFSGPGGISTKLRLLALEGAQLLAES
jgi:methylated-DNA-[protein]-cysteine S-methyltransferase